MNKQGELPGFGPDARDAFRFTWHNTMLGARVWVEHRGKWRAGEVAGRGRQYATVAIESASGRRRRVRKLYAELRRLK
ncbi:MAG TPA: hypothetical protein VMU16_04380 [Candidatus Binataceae bacterium]|nr:hypothetical protein [Candidatus Binataceae bacterium]